MSDTGQIPLELPLDVQLRREDLIESSSNTTAVELIDGWPDWPGKLAILAGPTGSGKTHFATIWAKQSNARSMQMQELDSLNVQNHQDRNLVLEDAFAGGVDEDALFHLINHARSNNLYILMTSRNWPSDWGITLPDLVSRLRTALLVELSEPDEALLRMVIHKIFADRQIDIDPSIVDFLVVRIERSLGSAIAIVEALDQEALATRSPITKPLAGRVLKRLGLT